jgi:hypothetical protein
MLKAGDLVLAQGQNGVFRVRALSEDCQTAEIELFNLPKQKPMLYLLTVPTVVLSPFKEDAR